MVINPAYAGACSSEKRYPEAPSEKRTYSRTYCRGTPLWTTCPVAGSSQEIRSPPMHECEGQAERPNSSVNTHRSYTTAPLYAQASLPSTQVGPADHTLGPAMVLVTPDENGPWLRRPTLTRAPRHTKGMTSLWPARSSSNLR